MWSEPHVLAGPGIFLFKSCDFWDVVSARSERKVIEGIIELSSLKHREGLIISGNKKKRKKINLNQTVTLWGPEFARYYFEKLLVRGVKCLVFIIVGGLS